MKTDLVTSIAAAIGGGRRAAFGVHAYLTGENSRVYAIGEDNTIVARDDLAGTVAPGEDGDV